MSDRIDVTTAVVGCGYWGKNLVRNFDRLSNLRTCCDASESIRERMAAAYPDANVTGDYGSVLEDPAVEAVVLATPAPTHAELAIQAFRAGKHVFVEKPLALSTADAEAVLEAARSADRVLAVGHLLEYHPAINHIKGMLDRGELGDVLYMYGQRVNLGKVRSDENALWSLAPHDISIVLYLLGEEPVEVTASGQAFLQEGIEDVVFFTMRFPSGRLAHIHVSWLDPHKERRLTVVGSEKMVVFDDMKTAEKIRIYDKGVTRPATEAAEYGSFGEYLQLRDGDIVSPRIPAVEPLALECTEFLKAVATGSVVRSDGADGVAVVRVLEAAQRSLDANGVRYAQVLEGVR